MLNLIKYFLVFIFMLFVRTSDAQIENFWSKSSAGFMVGGSYYIGDLNPYAHFRRTNISGGFIYRFYINSRIEFRGAFRFGFIEGYDSDASDPLQVNRNLSFQTNIYELTGGLEFSYKNYKLGNDKYSYTPYLFVDLGIFRMNPQAEYNDEVVDLQPLGTEGQGSPLSEKDPYNLTQLVVPLGVGFKFNLGDNLAISLEYGIRKTFTDYIDDVGEGDYINPQFLAEENGSIAARLSDRSLSDNPSLGNRGNRATNDWYSMFGIMLTFSLGDPDRCFYASR